MPELDDATSVRTDQHSFSKLSMNVRKGGWKKGEWSKNEEWEDLRRRPPQISDGNGMVSDNTNMLTRLIRINDENDLRIGKGENGEIEIWGKYMCLWKGGGTTGCRGRRSATIDRLWRRKCNQVICWPRYIPAKHENRSSQAWEEFE